MKLAFVYAGQGSQKVGMGKDFYEKYPLYKKTIDETNPELNIKKLSFEGPEEALKQTKNTQPCMVSFAVGVTELLKEAGIVPEMVAGLSLGEYSALYTAAVFDATTVIDLVAFRGQVMSDAVAGIESSMVAILGLDMETTITVCQQASECGIVQVANKNCPGQLVIGGETKAVEKAVELAKAAGAKRCIPLQVSGPFHTDLMKTASDALAKKFIDLSVNTPTIPVLLNVTGTVYAEEDSLKEILAKQVCQTVLFEDIILEMEAQGIDTIIEIGPGKVLSGFIKKTAKSITTYAIEDVESFEIVSNAIKGVK